MRWLTSSLQSFNVYLLVSQEISNRVTWIKLKKWVCWEFCCTSCWGYFPEWATYATVLEIARYCNFLGQRLLYCTIQYLLPNNQPIPRHLRCHVIHPLWWRRSLTRHTTKGCTFQTCPSNIWNTFTIHVQMMHHMVATTRSLYLVCPYNIGLMFCAKTNSNPFNHQWACLTMMTGASMGILCREIYITYTPWPIPLIV